MEPHPVPQNVTTFQFKLVGDMTLKQFLYLVGGVGTAYLLFVFSSHDYPLISWPLIIISALLGVAFAFLPIGSRPLDRWLAAFLKAIYSPTKRVWQKGDRTFKEDSLFNSRLLMYLSGAPKPLTSQPSTVPQPVAPLPTTEDLGKTVDLARQAQDLQIKIIQTEKTLSQIKEQSQQPSPVPVDYSQEVNKILADLQSLVNQASTIKQQLHLVTAPSIPPQAPPATPALPQEKVKVVIPVKPKQTQLALTIFPNVINGIIKDKQNNYLEGVVVVIYNKQGLPVRALKSNKLGQFTGSTPLPNGTYTLELEKEGFTFDVLQMELNGGVLPPLMITNK